MVNYVIISERVVTNMKNMIACCGLDCEKCDAYLATLHNDDALREKTAKLWSKLNHAPITPDMINCTGCRVDGAKTPYCESLCAIRKCAVKKGFPTCASCTELNSCDIIAAVLNYSEEARKNLTSK